MRHSFWFTIGLFLFPFILLAQPVNFAPVGAIWRYNMSIYTLDPYGSKQYRYVVTGDTLINGWNARRLQGEVWGATGFQPAASMTRFVASVEDRVYHWVDTSFVLLYDFGASPGDTIHSRIGGGSFPFDNHCASPPPLGFTLDFSYVVDSVAIRTVGGLAQRVLFTHPTNFDEMWYFPLYPVLWTVTERIGSVSGTWFGEYPACITEGYWPSLRCYSDADMFFEGVLTGTACDSVVSAAGPVPALRVDIGPNPFQSDLSVTIPDDAPLPLWLQISGISGSITDRIPLSRGPQRIALPARAAGLYFWQIEHLGAIVARGKLVKM